MINRTIAYSLLALVLLPAGVRGQQAIAYDATREQLRQQLDSLRSEIPGDRGGEAGRATELLRQAQRIKGRLEDGDVRPGDVIRMTVQGDSVLSGTYRVTEGHRVEVPTVGSVNVGGLLYSEVRTELREALESVMRTPRVQVQPLIRIGVLGSVNEPGFYDLSPSATVSDALMAAGGPTQTAQVQKTRLRKPESGEDDEDTRVRSLTGRSLADLGVARGDEVFVPTSGGGFTFQTALTIFGGLTSVAFLVERLF